jgi:diguanylate cyclase (GGDEF)-like protein
MNKPMQSVHDNDFSSDPAQQSSSNLPLLKFDVPHSESLNLKSLTARSTLKDLTRFYCSVDPGAIGSILASEFKQHIHLPGVLVLNGAHLLAFISRRTFLERLSQPYGLELFLKRPIGVFLSIANMEKPLILSETERIDCAVQLALQRSSSQIYEPIIVRGIQQEWSILDFQTLLLAQSQILAIQKEELAQQSQKIETLNSHLTWQASHDPLTHLMNRRAFEQHLQSAISDLNLSSHRSHILCYLDLDRFKIVNDTCGHIAGDELLKEVSNLMRNYIRKTDIVGRLGGDEFAILLYNCNLEAGLKMANLLRQNLEDLRFTWDKHIFRIGASIGVMVINDHSADLKEVLRSADNACYVAKNKGKNRVYVYQDDDKEVLNERITLNSLGKLQEAIDNNQLCLYFQPLIMLNHQNLELSDSSIMEKEFSVIACEILLRFKDEKGNILPPAPLILAAERYKLMHQIDRWVFESLLSYLDKNRGYNYPLYMVNLSGETLRDEEFFLFVKSQIDKFNISPTLLCFEITETAAITNFNQASQLIYNLRNLGCSFALDDFGSGMSSFTYLKHFAVDFIKVDGMFAQDLNPDSLNLSIIKAIHEVGHAIGLKTIVEGIEDPSFLPLLNQLGIEYAQGFGIQQPQPLKVTSVLNDRCRIVKPNPVRH